jgi:hypothetical protein
MFFARPPTTAIALIILGRVGIAVAMTMARGLPRRAVNRRQLRRISWNADVEGYHPPVDSGPPTLDSHILKTTF